MADRFISFNPATDEALGNFPISSAEEIDQAVARAREVAAAWRERSASERCHHLRALIAGMAAAADPLATAVSREIGKPLQDAYAVDILTTLQALAWLARHAPRLLQPRRLARRTLLTPEPYGVIGVIGTWNYPLFLDLTTLAWALAAGNAVVWKPSELATVSALAVFPYLQQAGLPVFLATGNGATGQALCRAGIDKLAFTGSAATGRKILTHLAERGTPSVMELSGNDAFILCADAEIRTAARSAVWARCCNAGQSCAAPQRFYVPRELYDTFLLECRQVIWTLRPGVDYGPLRTAALRLRAGELTCEAVARGARLLEGGYPLDDRPGCYYAPTLLADCDEAMRVVREDFFGPVLPICPVQDEAEAIARANSSEMALGASVWTRDLRRGRRIAAQLRAGVVAINTDTLLIIADPALPFGGLGASGFGKLRGAAGLEEFVHWKAISEGAIVSTRRHLFPYREPTLPILRALIGCRVWGVGGRKNRV